MASAGGIHAPPGTCSSFPWTLLCKGICYVNFPYILCVCMIYKLIIICDNRIVMRQRHCDKFIIEPPHDKTNKMTCAPSEDSDQSGHLPSLIRVFAVRMEKAWVLSYPLSAQRRLIRLGGCPGSSESSLGAVILLVLSRGGSYVVVYTYKGHPVNSKNLLTILVCL